MRNISASIALVVAAMLPAVAHAQDSRSELARRDLLQRAERARGGGDHAATVALATQAAQIRQTPSLRLMLAQEHRALGHLVEALDHATACVREAEAEGSLRGRDRLVEVCRTLVAEVEPSIGRLSVSVTPASAPGLHVHVDDVEMPAALVGVPSPSMPGRVVVRVEATGFRSASRAVDVTAGHETRVDLALEEAHAPLTTAAVASPPRESEPRVANRRSIGPGAGPWVTVGAGAAGLAAGVVLFLLSNGARDDRDAACSAAGCQDRARDDDERYRGLLLGADIALGLGGAAVAGGLLWWLVAPRGDRAPAAIAIVPLQAGAVLQIGGPL